MKGTAMMMNTTLNPPPLPSADAILAAHTLLAIIADPKGAQARLDQLTAHIQPAHQQLRQQHA